MPSCAAIALTYPSAPNGVYTLSASGNTYQAFCDVAAGGWELVLSVSSSSSAFYYDSPLWTNAALLNAGTPDPQFDGDGKYSGAVYQQVAAIRGCGSGQYDAASCMNFTLQTTYPSLVNMFATVPESSVSNLILTNETGLPDYPGLWAPNECDTGSNNTQIMGWFSMFGLTPSPTYYAYYYGCYPGYFLGNGPCFISAGVNYVDPSGNSSCGGGCHGAKTRFGLFVNNECGPESTDFVVGFGAQAEDGIPAAVGAGMAVTIVVSEFGRTDAGTPSSGTIWIKAPPQLSPPHPSPSS
jgi:hypothetical protein